MGSATYIDNEVPIGSRVENIMTGGGTGTSVLASAVFENITLNYEGVTVKRHDEIGKQNGFTIVKTGGGTGNATIQIPKATSKRPSIGDWFADAFDGSSTATEHWVIASLGQPFDAGSYYKVTTTLELSPTPPTA
jgi:hypothetical protein